VCRTNHGVLDVGKPTGVFASEMTVPYYAFLDAGMDVDVASPPAASIPSTRSRSSRCCAARTTTASSPTTLRAKVTDSLAIGDLDMADYDIVYLAGGWGAAFDFGFSEALAEQITRANASAR
jgi:putative intracellular protease/amidase